ncbi:oxygenase MpaB family protein [Streptomyces sp. NPDC015532]|uniref:oxygenase MpaB family protein n=1 Tax=Streptomyces sp. NPDC015532 TaxID=3364960 RepID=UPI0036F850C1
MAPQLLLLQVAHPVVGSGVEGHSTFRAAPWPRLKRTLFSLSTVIYGGRRAAAEEARRRITGTLAIAYWATHRPGTDPVTRRPLGAR